MYRWLMIIVLCGVARLLYAQPTYGIRLEISVVDTASGQACYDLQIQNTSDSTWQLGFANIGLFYDYSVGCYSEDSSDILLNNLNYDYTVRSSKSDPIDDPILPYHQSLGFLRINPNIKQSRVPVDIIPGEWIDIFRICFDIEEPGLRDPGICMQINFLDSLLLRETNGIGDILQTYDADPASVLDVNRTFFQNVIPNGTKTSCFILEENTVDLCTDGIDNDEDGLTDCEDGSSCAALSPTIDIQQPGGCDDRPSLVTISGYESDGFYSINEGLVWQQSNTFESLNVGTYSLWIARTGNNQCIETFDIKIVEMPCSERSDSTCMDGIDNDDDGLIDCDDMDCMSPVEISVTSPTDCPTLSDGSITAALESLPYLVSVDSGQTFVDEATISELSEGEYYVAFQNKNTSCILYHGENPIVIAADIVCPGEATRCSDGLDNDLDGLTDCSDPDCADDLACRDLSSYYIPSAIQPRSDINDKFGLYPAQGHAVVIESMTVYDRWGGVMHQVQGVSASDSRHYWTGIYRGEPVAPGVYVYEIRISEYEHREQIMGVVTVVY